MNNRETRKVMLVYRESGTHPVLHGSQPEYRSEKINGQGLLTLPYKLNNSGWAGDAVGLVSH